MEMPVVLSPTTTLARRLRVIANAIGLMFTMRGVHGRVTAPLVIPVWKRILRLATRFETLVARVAAGLPAAPVRVRAKAVRVAARAAGASAAAQVPTGRGWLVGLMRETEIYRAKVEELLADPEMAALLAAAPEAGRILRPFCRMLGVNGGALLALPAGRKLTPRKSRAGQYRPRKRVVKVKAPELSGLAQIYAALGPKPFVQLPGHRSRKPPWIGIWK
jgi:hypothetical protein